MESEKQDRCLTGGFEGRMGGVVSANNIAKYAGQMSAPLLLGLLQSAFGFAIVFLVFGVIGAEKDL
ncbi:MAG: hypothetical protein ACLFN4_04070 [Candidatus Acetothermia bacterium]